MWKDVAIVGIAAAIGTYGDQKFGAAIESKAVAMKLPPMVAHVAVVGGFAALGYLLVKSVM